MERVLERVVGVFRSWLQSQLQGGFGVGSRFRSGFQRFQRHFSYFCCWDYRLGYFFVTCCLLAVIRGLVSCWRVIAQLR